MGRTIGGQGNATFEILRTKHQSTWFVSKNDIRLVDRNGNRSVRQFLFLGRGISDKALTKSEPIKSLPYCNITSPLTLRIG